MLVCSAMLCYAMPCYAMPYHTVLQTNDSQRCFAVPSHRIPSHPIPSHPSYPVPSSPCALFLHQIDLICTRLFCTHIPSPWAAHHRPKITNVACSTASPGTPSNSLVPPARRTSQFARCSSRAWLQSAVPCLVLLLRNPGISSLARACSLPRRCLVYLLLLLPLPLLLLLLFPLPFTDRLLERPTISPFRMAS